MFSITPNNTYEFHTGNRTYKAFYKDGRWSVNGAMALSILPDCAIASKPINDDDYVPFTNDSVYAMDMRTKTIYQVYLNNPDNIVRFTEHGTFMIIDEELYYINRTCGINHIGTTGVKAINIIDNWEEYEDIPCDKIIQGISKITLGNNKERIEPYSLLIHVTTKNGNEYYIPMIKTVYKPKNGKSSYRISPTTFYINRD